MQASAVSSPPCSAWKPMQLTAHLVKMDLFWVVCCEASIGLCGRLSFIVENPAQFCSPSGAPVTSPRRQATVCADVLKKSLQAMPSQAVCISI